MDLRRPGYWEDHYRDELENFENNGDEGDVWFGESLTKRIVSKIILCLTETNQEADSKMGVLDIGCGNAFLLCTLHERLSDQYDDILKKTRLVGIDYAEKSIELSKRIVESRSTPTHIELFQCDLLDPEQLKIVTKDEKFEIIVDKGTFDAICLITDDTARARVRYMQSVQSIVRPGSLFILASCNHTEEDLQALFNDNQVEHEVVGKIETPKFRFGGSEGSQVCCLVIKFV